MAVRINLDQLTEKQKETVRKHLYMQPKQVGFFKNKRFVNSKDPILLYTIDKPNRQIILPYTFANALLGQHINANKEYPPGKYNFVGSLRPHQEPIVSQALSHLEEKGTTTLGVYPGCGKTIMSMYLGSLLGGLTLVVFPTLMIKKGWISTCEKFTDAKVWTIDGKMNIPSECNVILTMDTAFHKIPKNILAMVKTLIIDEAHMFCVPSRINCLLGCTPKYVIACTATLERRDGMHSIIHAVCGTHGIFIKSDKRFTVYKLDTGIKVEVEQTKTGNANWAKLVADLSFHPTRNAFIIDIVERNPEHKIMILTWNVKHAYFLCDMLKSRDISADVLAGNKSDYNDSRILVGSISKISTGFDEAAACHDWGGVRANMMILTGSTKSLSGLEQTLGRVFRAAYPVVIDLVDNNRICKSHWRERRKWYEHQDQNCEIFYIQMNKDEGFLGSKGIDQNMNSDQVMQLHKQRLEILKEKTQNN